MFLPLLGFFQCIFDLLVPQTIYDGAHHGGHSLMEHGHCLILVSSVAGPRMQIGEETRAIEENYSGWMRGTGVESLHQPSGRHDLQ